MGDSFWVCFELCVYGIYFLDIENDKVFGDDDIEFVVGI